MKSYHRFLADARKNPRRELSLEAHYRAIARNCLYVTNKLLGRKYGNGSRASGANTWLSLPVEKLDELRSFYEGRRCE